MRRIMIIAAAILTLATTAVNAEETCPGHRAATIGYDEFDAFHTVLAPTWHVAWPDSDFVALFAAGPQFDSLSKPILMLKPDLKTQTRRQTYMALRSEFAADLVAFSKACAQRNKDEAYQLMPHLHDSYEALASALLPVYYPEFEGFVVTLNLIIETHLPKKNLTGLKGSTETLIAKAEHMTQAPVPDELKDVEADVKKALQGLRQGAAALQSALESEDLKSFGSLADELNADVQGFVDKYI